MHARYIVLLAVLNSYTMAVSFIHEVNNLISLLLGLIQ
jgi:hypothetical protein